jgi:hypothetical protein
MGSGSPGTEALRVALVFRLDEPHVPGYVAGSVVG